MELLALFLEMNSIWCVLSLATSYKWEVNQMDMNPTFFHVDLQEEIYMQQPLGYVHNDSIIIYRINKSLYGLK